MNKKESSILPGYILMIKLIAVAEIRSDSGREKGSTFSDSYQVVASNHPTLGKLTPITVKLDSVSSCRVQIRKGDQHILAGSQI